jgi:threonyl-tRNA synthetase
VQLCHGPPTENGFFYDSYTGKDIFLEKDYPAIEKAAAQVVKESQTFSRLVLTKLEALRLFSNNPFKVQLIESKIPEGGRVTAYRCGNLIDLCTGPHISSTKIIKAFKVLKNSSAYWLGKAGNDSLQRVYGVSFPSKKELTEYITLLEEAAKRDHRNLGTQMDLFHMNPLSPGCSFMYPKGAVVYNKLVDMIRQQYRVRGY